MITNIKFNTIGYFLSQYLWLFYILVPIFISLCIPRTTSKSTITSSNIKYNKSDDPTIFCHLSDTHINIHQPKSVTTFSKTVTLIKSYSPDFIVHTGDIVDNYDSIHIPKYGDQDESNWQIYKNISDIFHDIEVIETVGNHDMFGVESYDSPHNYALDYTHSMTRNEIKSEANFQIRVFEVGRFLTVIALNPLSFPFVHSPLIMNMPLSTNILDILEDEVEKSKGKCIVVSHFPIGSIKSGKSNNRKSLTDIVDNTEKVAAYLSGHWHPKNPSTFHYGKKGVDIVATASFKREKFGIVSIDNGGIAWSPVDINKPTNGVITYPIPADQLSSSSIFNDMENAEIRVVIFSDKNDLKIQFKIIDKINSKTVFNGFLNYKKQLVNGRSLYSFPFNSCIQNFGEYRIEFNGDFVGSTDFVVKDSVTFKRKEIGYFTGLYTIIPYIYAIFVCILIFITILIPFNCYGFQFKLDKIEEWIETSVGDSLSNWLISIFCGFLLVRSRFQQLPLLFKIFGFLTVIYSILGPLFFTQVEKAFGFVWLFGYVLNSKVIIHEDGAVYSLLYLATICALIVLLSSSFGVKEWHAIQIFDIFVFAICLGLDLLILLSFIYNCAGQNLAGANIAFVFIPFGFIVMLIVWLSAFRNGTGCCDDDDDNDNGNGNEFYKKQLTDDYDLTQNLNTLPNQIII